MPPPHDIPVTAAPITVLKPVGPTAPLVFDSPHSGRTYPAAFHFSCPRPVLERAEDRFLDKLLDWAPTHGIPLLLANFPRTYIDVNRALTDIDETMLDGPWPGAVPTDLSRAGIGLIRRLLTPTLPVYNAPLSVQAVRDRITDCYLPYYAALETALNTCQQQHGCTLHINWHSMPSRFGGTKRMPDFVLGSRHGTTCTEAMMAAAQGALSDMGYSVQLNDPYPGQEIIARTGHPAQGRFALQIEINKALYLDEGRNKLHSGHIKLIADLKHLTAPLHDTMRDMSVPLAAD